MTHFASTESGAPEQFAQLFVQTPPNRCPESPQQKTHSTNKKKKQTQPEKIYTQDKNIYLETPTDINTSPQSFPPPKKERQSKPKKPELKVESKSAKKHRYAPIPIIYDTHVS